MLENKGVRQLAAAYQLKGKIFIQGYSKTTQGLSVLDGPIFIVEENDNLSVLGQAVINALNDCKTGVYHETREEYDPKKDPMVLVTGMKSWKALGKVSKSIDAEVLENEKIIFTPRRFLGTAGYNWVKDKEVISDLDLEHLGRALMQALAASENPYMNNSAASDRVSK